MIILFFLFSYTVKADSSLYIEPYTYLYGNVELVIDTVRITSERAFLSDDSIRVWGNLIIEKDDLRVYGGIGRYFFERVYYLEKGMKAERGEDTLVAKRGIFYEERKEVYARDSMSIWGGERRIEADEGRYNFKEDKGTLWMNVHFIEHRDSVELICDTLTIYSDTLFIGRKNILKQESFKAYSDLLFYYPKKDSIVLFGCPLVVTENDTLFGDRIEIKMKDGKLSRLWAIGNVSGKRWEK